MTRKWCLRAFLLFMGGCSQSDIPSPPEIIYSKDTCKECGMIISEEKHSCGCKTAEGQVYRFDDVGCMLRFLANPPKTQAQCWLHDHVRSQWILAEAAFLVRDNRFSTPMGSGILSFKYREEAEEKISFLNGNPTILSFKELQNLIEKEREQL